MLPFSSHCLSREGDPLTGSRDRFAGMMGSCLQTAPASLGQWSCPKEVGREGTKRGAVCFWHLVRGLHPPQKLSREMSPESSEVPGATSARLESPGLHHVTSGVPAAWPSGTGSPGPTGSRAQLGCSRTLGRAREHRLTSLAHESRPPFSVGLLRGGLSTLKVRPAELGQWAALGDPLCTRLGCQAPPQEGCGGHRPLLPTTCLSSHHAVETSQKAGGVFLSETSGNLARRAPPSLLPGALRWVPSPRSPSQQSFSSGSPGGIIPAGSGQAESKAPHPGPSHAGEELFSPPERIFQVFFNRTHFLFINESLYHEKKRERLFLEQRQLSLHCFFFPFQIIILFA